MKELNELKSALGFELNEMLNKYSDNPEEEESVMRIMKEVLREGF